VDEPSPVNSILERLTWKLWAWAMCGPLRYRMTMLAVRIGVRLARFLPWHPGKLGAWTRGRELPEVPKRAAFRAWWRQYACIHKAATAGRDHKAATAGRACRVGKREPR
jgi:hypothetical protein